MSKLLMLSILINVVTTTKHMKYTYAVYDTTGPGYSYDYIQNTSGGYFTKSSLLECIWDSLDKKSEFLSYNKATKSCVNYLPDNIMTIKEVNDKDQFAYYRTTEWIRIYALSMKSGSSVYYSFFNKNHFSDWKVDTCQGKFCPDFFRHPIMDIWHQLPIEEVKLVIYKEHKPVVTMVFDGHDSTLNSWFSLPRLKSSPWKDLKSNTSRVQFHIREYWNDYNMFSIRIDHHGCSKDFGWLIIVNKKPFCKSAISTHYPHIIYSANQTATVWVKEKARADSMAVFIRLRN